MFPQVKTHLVFISSANCNNWAKTCNKNVNSIESTGKRVSLSLSIAGRSAKQCGDRYVNQARTPLFHYSLLFLPGRLNGSAAVKLTMLVFADPKVPLRKGDIDALWFDCTKCQSRCIGSPQFRFKIWFKIKHMNTHPNPPTHRLSTYIQCGSHEHRQARAHTHARAQ